MQLSAMTTRTIFVQLQPTRIIALVLGGGIGAFLALFAGKVNYYAVCFLRHLTFTTVLVK